MAKKAEVSVQEHRYDRLLLVATLVLMSVGIVMVYSASVFAAETRWGDGAHFLKRQMLFAGIGVVALVTTLQIPHQVWQKLAYAMLLVGFVLLVVVLVPGVSSSVKGANRWIDLYVVRFQPAEAIKILFVIYLSAFLANHRERLADWRVIWIPQMIVTAGIVGLLMLQPDFGSSIICAGMMMLMVWLAGCRNLHLGALVLLVVPLGLVAIALEPYRVKRLFAFLSPDADPLGVGYQINQALISFGSGDWTGVGLGGSRQKLLYLPDAHTDFIFSIIGEELGLVGVVVMVTLYGTVVWRGWTIARRATSPFGQLLAYGLTALIGFQAATNMAVATALLPTKGLTLPLVSYGGSSLIITSVAIGLLLNISRRIPAPAWLDRSRAPKKKRGPKRSTAAVQGAEA